ncbi:hypothetical protein [Novosphingobium beihaiensis]|uniref:Uncharacterized protein n=1 Tax=Novosphingobium beihaiensis TaxID=2930389 RepID=A0ABT0BSA5_9SPHN|nr:hypothetical protein [Novosphingobium beihaiensis]MCJ2187901.1 hypothetical protein [Novosphingobium beihaiensis]
MEKSRPVDVLRDSNLKASVFRNDGEKGPFYSTTFARTYTDDQGQPRDSHSFAGNELLRLSELARKAYDRTRELHRENAPSRNEKREAFTAQRSQQDRGSRGSEHSR